MSNDCVFCKIVAGQIPANKVYEDDQVLAFHDIQPQAPVHVLVIPKKHLASVNDLHADDSAMLGRVFAAVQHVAKAVGIAETGYRTVTNTGKDAGQVVPHLHFHVMGGKTLGHLG
ncbi:MAG TPA: histidine triad nucleotide-binding protein [Symbiobacteriaceae bacterium]|nr:histidine triad nucleotide-binding protein [Symbiobacteriaceae bacterium]